MSEKKDYTFRVIWSDEDEEFVGLCDAFPSLSWLAPTREEALQGIQLLVKSITVESRSLSEMFGALPVDEPLPDIHKIREMRHTELGRRIHDGEE